MSHSQDHAHQQHRANQGAPAMSRRSTLRAKDLPPTAYQVNCRNPWDLTKAKNAIVDQIETVSQSLRTTGSSQKIIVLMGEDHYTTTHKMLQSKVLQEMVARHHACVFGYEISHNYLETSLEKSPYFSKKIAKKIHENDPLGDVGLRWLLTFGLLPPSTKSVFLTTLQQSIPFAVTDAADDRLGKKNTDEIFLDENDPLTARFIKARGRNVTEKISAVSSDGMAIRNSVMVENMLNALDRHGRTIGIQQCGQAHVFGDVDFRKYDEIFLYEDSLSAQFTQAGAIVIPVLFSNSKSKGIIPRAAHESFENLVYISGIANARYAVSEAEDELRFMAALNNSTEHRVPIMTREIANRVSEELGQEIRTRILGQKKATARPFLGNLWDGVRRLLPF